MKLYSYGPTVLRLALATVFAAHGLQKLFGLWGGPSLSQTGAFFTSLGLTPGLPLAIFVGVVELVGGALLVAGLFVRWVSIALAIEMAVAAYKVHLPNGFFLNWNLHPGIGHGVEMNLVLIGALVSLIFTGAGALSIDEWRVSTAEEAALGRARLRSKI